MLKHLSVIAFFSFFLSISIQAQVDVTMQSGTFFSCDGAFIDSGGQGGPGYGNNEYFVTTICPETDGDVVTVDFITFSLDQTGAQNTWDYMAIYDGDDTSAPSLGVYTGNDLAGLFVSATSQNTSGCLTFVFDSNANGTGNFGGSITCSTPCDRPISSATDDGPVSRRICVGDEINFDGTASFPAAGFNIVEYNWDFADGTTDNSGPVVTHSWDEPGEYIVELYLTDDNGCSSTNLVSLQFLVATYPTWSPFPGDTDLCLGEEVCFDAFPDDYEELWSGAEESYENPDTVELPDDVGACNVSEINVSGFSPGQTITNVNDLQGIDVSMNHSFLFDLVISVTCPNGQTVLMHQQMEQPGGGADVGSNGTNLGVPDGDYFTYTWAPDAVQGTWSQVATNLGDVLPEGEYNSLQPMEGFIGCEMNGTWQIEICDLWGGDDGELGGWALNFDPSLLPDVTEFTPEIGLANDSSFWVLPPNPPFVTSFSDDQNNICVLPQTIGSWDFTYSVVNNHGCQYDSTLTLTVEEALQAEAGPDVIFCGDNTVLEGGFIDLPSGQCAAVAGTYNFCYENSVISEFTYCPDNPGDGISFIDITFQQGSVENFFDEFYVYDGADSNAPLLAGPIYGDLSGLQFIATNPNGCLTIAVEPDGSVDCGSPYGSQTEWIYEVGCGASSPDYVYEWTPTEFLSDPNSPTPILDGITEPTVFTLTTYPTGRPECASSDQTTVSPSFVYSYDFEQSVCPGLPGSISVDVDETSGDGPWTFELYENNALLQTVEGNTGEVYVFDELYQSDYDLVITELNCSFTEEIDLNAPAFAELILSNDTTVCQNGTATFTAAMSIPLNNLQFFWSTNEVGESITVSPQQSTTVSVYATYNGVCESELSIVTVDLYAPLAVGVSEDVLICADETALIEANNTSGGIPPYNYEWTNTQGETLNQASQTIIPTETTSWCVSMSDQCESTPVQQCIDVVLDDEIPTAFTADTLGGCLPVLIQFNSEADNEDAVASMLWDFGNGAISDLNYTTAHNYGEAGIYSVGLTITSELGCIYDTVMTDMISIFKWPVADFSTDPVVAVLPNTTFNFINYSIGATDYYWNFNDFADSDEFEPSFTFEPNLASIYEVSLTVENDWGCVNSISRNVEVIEDFIIYVPNSFTPDLDGVNDVFAVTGIDIDESDYSLMVFDRWGNKVFETSDLHAVWNGSVNGGEYFAPDGMYVYQIITRSLTTKDPKEFVGHVNLIR